jgi:hypothetical protein
MALILIPELKGWIGNGKVEWAGSGPSPQLRNRIVKPEEADIQSTVKARSVLHRRKAAESPKLPLG